MRIFGHSIYYLKEIAKIKIAIFFVWLQCKIIYWFIGKDIDEEIERSKK